MNSFRFTVVVLVVVLYFIVFDSDTQFRKLEARVTALEQAQRAAK